ncbi:hypothetical protein [Klebsiella grimontii]|uniref:hypothetical protein n=1 Tax=Klebsiella grimontii TaxID=2058152 RepID=UPI001912C7DF|nr:hypothetical protein [Klebsiella grimontii]
MGFESPAKDYIEDTLTITKLCRMDANSRTVKTDCGYAILDMSLRPEQGDIVLIRYGAMMDFGKLQGRSFITREGEVVEGEDVEVFGVVTFTVNDLRRDDSPV